MTYPENLSLVELTQHYVNYRSEEVLNELARRDKLNQMTCEEQCLEEPDNQMIFDFHKEVVSAKKVANNESVKDAFEQGTAWAEAYEIGRRVGFKQGIKEAQSCVGIKEEGECQCKM